VKYALQMFTRHTISTDTKIWLYKAIVVSVGIYAMERNVENNINDCTEVDFFHHWCLRKMRHISGSHNKRRSPAKNWLKKIDRYCSIAKIPRDRPHTASTKPSTFEGCNVMDSRWWQAKKRTSKEDMAQNIPSGRPDESQHHMGRGWTHCNGSSCLASRCPMCLLAREELRLNTKQMKLQKKITTSRGSPGPTALVRSSQGHR